MRTETVVLSEKRNVILTAYLQEVGGSFTYVPKRPAVLILPGGGYQYCSRRESDPVAFAYLTAGYQTFVLNYGVKEHAVWPGPLEDYEQAMELIRGNAEQWGLYPDKVAVVGFSAGGHLAACAATMSRNRPNAAILGYAVTGDDVLGCNPTAPDAVAAVDHRTCPCFVFATRTDEVVPVENSIAFTLALTKACVSFESHIYAYGPHGFSSCDPSTHPIGTPIAARARSWMADSISWLKDMLGDFGDGALTEPRCKPRVGADREPFLSTECTVGLLLEHEAACALLPELVAQAKITPQLGLLKKMTLRGLYGFMKVPPQVMAELDEKLSAIPNERA